jgi:hypothetical protein
MAPATKPLGNSRKLLGVLVVAVGMCSFFSPIAILDPPMLGRSQWSPLHIARNVYEGKLPVAGGQLDENLFGMALIYALMPLALVAMYAPGSPRPLIAISTIGFVPSFLAKFWHHAFMKTFGCEYFGAGHLQRGLTWWVLPWIMPALLAIAFAKDLD